MKTTVIGEIGSNWETKDNILYACEWLVEHGCIPKLQLWKTSKVVNRKRNPSMFGTMNKYELSREWVKDINTNFPTTIYSVFDLDSLAFLEAKIKPIAYKIASPDCVYWPLVDAIAKTDKQVYVSTGGATLDEIRECAKRFKWQNITLMECNASYPAKCAYLGNLRDRINGSRLIPWGYSNHTLSKLVPAVAVSLGAVVIEQHFNFVAGIKTPDSEHSLTQWDFTEMLNNIKEAENHLKTLEHPFPEEMATMALARRKKDGKR